MRYALYLRKSRQTEQGESIENQETLCRMYLAQAFPDDHAPYITVFQDEGFSGKSLARPQFQKMLSEIKKESFDFVVCYRLDRISRNIADFSSLVQLLAAYHTEFISIRERFDTSNPMGRAMMYISSVFSQLERETIAERIRDNMALLAKTGIWLGGITPTGFTSKKYEITEASGKRKSIAALVPLPAEWETVSFIFHSFLTHPNLAFLIEKLNQLGIQTKKGNSYTTSSIRGILTNPVYCAVDQASYQYFKQQHCIVCVTSEQFSKGCGYLAYHKNSFQSGHRKSQPKGSWILSCGAHPPILSGKDWIFIQQQLAKKSYPTNRSIHNPYCLFAGQLFCNACQSPMRPKLASHLLDSSRAPIFYYLCQTKEASKKSICQMQNLQGNQTDQQLEVYILSQLVTPQAIFQTVKKQLQPLISGGTIPKLILEEQNIALQTQIDKLLALLVETEDRTLLSLYQNQLKKLCQKKETLQQQMQIETQLSPSFSSSTASFCQKFQNPIAYFHTLSVPQKRKYFQQVVQKIMWDGTSLEIVWAQKP